MCEHCEAVPLTIPATGYLRAEGLAMTYVGKDADVAVLTVPARLPAAGDAIAIEHGGLLQFVRMLPGQDATEAARQHVRSTGHPSAVGVVVQIGKEDDVPVSLMRVQSVVHPIYDELSLWEGPAPLVGELARLEPIQKAELNPLNPRDFDRIVASLSSLVRGTSAPIESKMLTGWLNGLDFDWPTATDAQLLAASKSLNSAMQKASADIWGGIKGKLRTVSQRTASRSRVAEIKQHNLAIEGSMSVKDRAAINRSVATNAHYIRDYYGRVSPGMSAEMRLIAQQGIEDGLGTFEIGRNMKRGLGGKLKGLSDSYYNIVSSAVVHRSRSFSQLSSYRDGGIEKYIIDAVLDEVTTDHCFATGTMVTTTRGDVPIEQIRPGTMVLTGSGRYRPVRASRLSWSRNWIELHRSSGRPLTVTHEHPIMTSHGWKQAKDIESGGHLAVSELRQGVREDRGTQDILQPEMQDCVSETTGKPSASLNVSALRQYLRTPREGDEKVLQPQVLPRSQERRCVGRDSLQAMRQEVQGVQEISGAGPVSVLRHVMSTEGPGTRSGSQGSQSGMRDVWPGISDQFDRSSCGKDQATLLQEMPEAETGEDLCMVQRGIRGPRLSRGGISILLQTLLHEGQGAVSSGDVGGGDSEGLRNRVCRRVRDRPVLRGLCLSKANAGDRGGWGLLAHDQASSENGSSQGSDDSRPRTDTDPYAEQGFERGIREGTAEEYLTSVAGRERVTRIERRRFDRPAPAYNLEIDGDPTYFADGVLVHNCRFMHGKTLEVDAGLARYAAADKMADPTDIRYEMPWMTKRNIIEGEHEGKSELLVPGREGMQRVAVIEKSGYGKKDDVGSYSNAMSGRDLKNAHIGPPPWHGR